MEHREKDALRKAVKDLRAAMQNPDGTRVTQAQFAAMVGVGWSTLQRYEQLSPPSGKSLRQLATVASRNGQPRLSDIFRNALADELGVSNLQYTEKDNQ